ncbi:hypothetical protein GCK72_023242 [Caenorhabditis remanei]|uniref:Neurotransmitter-gated ion-channel ligand-binding domain-containing protein n=1 Tax=Caenorhabditis remanei TaxID=31234 RepID=A0A6A5FWC5_CAERE|nr:hypothetical protein GCK72_023242 [Caenorhabditis remanei]KAF1746785.1 hypothetical protein GCK72_023242 [Caenorhabditis remanei]
MIGESHLFYYDPQLYVPKYRDYLEAQGNLTRDLFKTYEKDVSPVYTWFDTTKPLGYDSDAPKRWNYTLFLYSLKLVEVNEPEEQVSVVLELMEYWYDPRLSWNASDYKNVTAIFTRQEKVWSPTLTPFGANELIDFRDQDFRLVCIDNLGQIYDYLSVRVSANCRMNVANFPFDTQTCQIRFSLPIFSYLEVQIFNEVYQGIQNVSSFERMGNSEWELINLTNRVDFLSFNDRFDVELSVFEIKIARNPLYYFYMIVFPSFVINSVSIVGVFLKGADKMSKLNVGLTNIMTMTFILGVIAKLETFIGTPLEYTCAVALELMTCANFLIMIGFWIDDS